MKHREPIEAPVLAASHLHREVRSMAFLDISSNTTFTTSRNIVLKFITNAFDNLVNWNDSRVTRNALLQLSARELNDIGLVPGDIDKISRR
jgi:uncharacterized protein YjiS (DUF1127 family)